MVPLGIVCSIAKEMGFTVLNETKVSKHSK